MRGASGNGGGVTLRNKKKRAGGSERKPLVTGQTNSASDFSPDEVDRIARKASREAAERRETLMTTIPCFILAAVLFTFMSVVGYDKYMERSGHHVVFHHKEGLKYRGYVLPPAVTHHGDFTHTENEGIFPASTAIQQQQLALEKLDPMDPTLGTEMPYLVIGLTGQLKRNDDSKPLGSFLHITVVDILERLTDWEVENQQVLLVVMVSNERRHHKKGLAKHMKKHCKRYIDAGVLEIISPGPSYYDDINALEESGELTDGRYSQLRRTLDVAYLMQYSSTRGRMYLHMHEDLVIQDDYVNIIRQAHANANADDGEDWTAVSTCHTTNNGVFFGHIMRVSDLHFFSYYLRDRYEESTMDTLGPDFFRVYDRARMLQLYETLPQDGEITISQAKFYDELFPVDPDAAATSHVWERRGSSLAQHLIALVRQSHGRDTSKKFDISLWMSTRGDKVRSLVK